MTKKIDVQWGDMDAAQHVNNAIYLQWIESARIDFILDLNEGNLINDENIGVVVAWQDCKYIRPVVFPDTIRLEVEKLEFLDEKIILQTTLFSESQKRVVAVSKQHIVSYDFQRKMKVPLPMNWID